MEKNATAKNKRLATYIPDDLFFSILSKLPVRSLKRFGCICKPWALLFENPNFLSIYRNNFISNCYSCCDEASLLLHLVDLDPPRNSLYYLSGEMFENMDELDRPNEFEGESSFFRVLSSGSINGIFCLHFFAKVVLWNPAIGDHKVLPPSPVESCLPPSADILDYLEYTIYGFGYDPVRDDYKVIRHVKFINFCPYSDSDSDSDSDINYVPSKDISFDPFWEIYNLRSNSWKKLDVDFPPSYAIHDRVRVYMDGVCHWLSRVDYKTKTYMASFDLSNEVYSTTLIPTDINDCFDIEFGWYWRYFDLVVLNGYIALISYHEKMAAFSIAILGELGVKESWIKLLTVGPFPCVEKPIGVGKKGEIFFQRKDKGLAWFDLSTQMIEELDFKAGDFDSHIIVYMESDVPIGGVCN